MIITESLDHKPAAVTLEPLPDGTTWLYLRKTPNRLKLIPVMKRLMLNCGSVKLPSASWVQTVPVKPPDTINAKFDDWWTYAAAWAEDEPLPTVQEQINAIYDTLAVMMGV